MPRLLDPKLDVVFKLLFADERNRQLLCSLLTAVLAPRRPIADVVVLNPETPKETVLQKGAVLDVRARLLDGTQTNVEMQAVPRPGFLQRALFYWARLHGSQLRRGEHYVQLTPTVSVFILSFSELPTVTAHSIFRLLEIREHAPLSDELALHFLELPKLPRRPPAVEDSPVLRWMRFFAAKTAQELEQLAMIDPDLREAQNALERLSADPEAQELARERELAAWNYEFGLSLARQEGEAKGRAEGEAKGRAEGEAKGRAEGEAKGRAEGEARGRAEGERRLLRKQLIGRFGELPEDAEARLEEATEAELSRWAERILTAGSVEDALA